MLENSDQIVILRNPIEPRISPNPRPEKSSRRMTRHQSRNATSPSANARITSVEACEPEFPPDEIMSGTKSASTTALSISFSKKPIAVAVNISPKKRMTSQPARFLIIESVYGHWLSAHDLGKRRLELSHHQVPQRNGAKQMSCAGLHDIAGINRFFFLSDRADVFEGIADSHLGIEPNEFGRHDPTGCVRGILQ